MATDKKKVKTVAMDDDMDFKDLDGLGEDMDFGDDGFDMGEREPSRSEVAKDLAKQAGTGFLETMVKKTAEKGLPSEYSSNYSEVMDLGSFAGDVVDKNKQKINKSLFKLGKEVKKILPMQIGLLDKYLERKEEEFAEFKQQSEEEMRSGAIASEVGSIFDKQLDIQKALEAKRSAEEEVSSKERLVSTKMTLDVLRSIDANAATSAAFATQISKEYFRKSLELQYKSFFVQADMLRTMRDHYKGFSIQFTNIEKNTALPEFVKLQNKERFADIMRTNTTQAIYNQLFSRNKYLETVKKRVTQAVDAKVSSFTDSLDDVSDAMSMMNDGSPGSGLRALAGVGASMGGDSLGQMAANKLGPKLQERLKDNKTLNTGANYLKAFAASPATLLRSLRDTVAGKETEAEGQGSGWNAKLYGMARAGLDLTGEEKINTGIKKDNYLDHVQPAIFDNRVHRSITEVIPLYLSKILKQNTDLSQMYYSVNSKKVQKPDSQELTYDYRGRKLDTSKNIRAKLQESVFSQKSTQNRTKTIASNSIVKSKANIARNESLSKEDKKKLNATLSSKKGQDALSEYYARAADIEGVKLDYDTLVNKSDEHPDLKKLIAANPELEKVINVLRTHSDNDNTYIDQGLSDIANPYPIEALKNLFKDASNLTRAKQPNLVTNANASTISKALSRFILNRGEDLTPGNVKSRLAFSFFKPGEFSEPIQQNIAILIDDVKRIESDGDMLLQSAMISLFALVNQSLKSNFEIDPGVFDNIRALYPDFVKGSNLTVENLAEGKLGDAADQTYVSFSEVRDVTVASNREIGLKREQVAAASSLEILSAKAKNRGAQFMKDLTAASSSPIALAEFVLKEAKSFKSTVASAMTKTSTEITDGFNRLGKQIDVMVKEGSGKAVNLAIQELNTVETKLDHYIKLSQDDIAQKTRELQQARDSVNEVTNGDKMKKLASKELEMFIRLGDKNIKALTAVKESVTKSRTALTQLTQTGVTAPTEVLKQMGAAVRDVLAQAKTQLAELEAAGASERLAAGAA